MVSCICDFKEVFFAILDWCGEHEAVLIAIAGFLSSVAIAKITSGLDIKNAISMRRLDAYEKAITYLSLKLNVYYNIQAAFESLKELVSEVDVMKARIAILMATFVRLQEIEKEDSKVSGVALYTVFSPYDSRPLVKELAYFFSRLNDFKFQLSNLPRQEERFKHLVIDFREDIERIAPLVENETKHLEGIVTQLKNEIAKDKRIKKLLSKS